jgi:WhiB family transcriptional regulator, redox-sensing transcriptional regulator
VTNPTHDLYAALGLPSLKTTQRGWVHKAACRQFPVDLFFNEKGDGDNSGVLAKRVCNACPVQKECLDWACEENEPFGIFGGRSPRERRHIKKGVTDWKVCGSRQGIKEHNTKEEPLCPACAGMQAEIARKNATKRRLAEAKRAHT